MITDEIKTAVQDLRDTRRMPGRGRALYDLNIWKGEQRRQLDEEYQRRLLAIEAEPEPTIEDTLSPHVLALVAKAAVEGVSRSKIRVALGKSSLAETDEIIALATAHLHEQIEAHTADPFALTLTGDIHNGGWPMYSVTLLDTGETFSAVYLVGGGSEVDRRMLRIKPSPAGSAEILDRIFESGAAAAMFLQGKA